MIHESEIKSILGHLQSCQEKEVIFDQKAITAAYEQERGRQSLAVKILSVFGGSMASLTFLGFLFIAGIYNSGSSLLFFGGVLIAGSIWLGKEYHKILFHTMSVSSPPPPKNLHPIYFTRIRLAGGSAELYPDFCSLTYCWG